MDLSRVEEARRITLDIGLDAFRETNLEPSFCQYGNKETTACGLVAVEVAMRRHPKDRLWYKLKRILGRRYRDGFMAGFDYSYVSKRQDVEWTWGWHDGSMLREAILAGALVPLDDEWKIETKEMQHV